MRILESILYVYKATISPSQTTTQCRYVPSCSEYAVEATAKHGVARGALLAALRFFRCNPFVQGGFDPVPQKNFRKEAHLSRCGETRSVR